MSLNSIISLVDVRDGVSIGGLILVALLTFIQIAPIKWNPWDQVLNFIGTKLNSGVIKKVNDLEKKIDTVEENLAAHITESEVRDLRDTRRSILEFCNSCMNDQRHTREQFEFVMAQCDDYEKYIEENKIKNGVISSAIKEIRRLYDRCLEKNDFLKEGELK